MKNLVTTDYQSELALCARGPLDVCDIGKKYGSDGELSCWSKLH